MLGMTLRQVAELIGVAHQHVHKYEKGSTRLTAGRLLVMAEALDARIDYFFDGLGDATSPEPISNDLALGELTKLFHKLPSRKHQAVICQLARALAKLGAYAEPDTDSDHEPSMLQRQG